MKTLLIFITIYFILDKTLSLWQARPRMPTNQANIKNLTLMQDLNQTSPNYLVNEDGMSLYMNSAAPVGESSCYGDCLEIFFPALVRINDTITLAKDLEEEKLGYIKRDDDGQQLAYNKYALFFFRNDTQPGDIKGQGYNSTWFLLDDKGVPIKPIVNITIIT